MSKYFVLVLALSLPPISTLADTRHCQGEGGQIDMNSCAHDAKLKTEKVMNDLLSQQLGRLTKPGTITRLKAAQEDWEKYRAASCLYEAGQREETGTMWPMAQDMCLSNFAQQRSEVLKTYLACTQNGCPE